MTTIRVVGIDAAFANMGFAHALLTVHNGRVVAFDCVGLDLVTTSVNNAKQVRKSSEELRRAIELKNGLARNCQGAQFAFVEVPSGSQSASAARALGIAVGVLASCPIAMIQVSPMEVKLAVNSNRKAKMTKEDIINWAHRRWPTAPWLHAPHKATIPPKKDSKGRITREGYTLPAGRLMDENEHLADALASIQAGIDTPEFQRLLTMMAQHETPRPDSYRLTSRRVPLN